MFSYPRDCAAILADPSNRSTTSRTAPLPPVIVVTIWHTSRTEGRASAGQALSPTILRAGKSFISSPIKQISFSDSSCRSEKARTALALSLQFLWTSVIPSLCASRSMRGLSSPDTSAIIISAFRASDRPMMSAKWNRFHSSPFGPHHTPPSVSTPSTSMAIALILGMCSTPPPQLLDNGLLAVQHSLHAVSHGLLDQPYVANQARDPVRFERCGMVRTPHRPVQRDMPLHHAGSHHPCRNRRRQSRLVTGVPDRHTATIDEVVNHTEL